MSFRCTHPRLLFLPVSLPWPSDLRFPRIFLFQSLLQFPPFLILFRQSTAPRYLRPLSFCWASCSRFDVQSPHDEWMLCSVGGPYPDHGQGSRWSLLFWALVSCFNFLDPGLGGPEQGVFPDPPLI